MINRGKKYFIRTFGCQMNIYDSVLIGENLENLGYLAVNEIEQADLILFNTCAIRGMAEHKALSELGATKKMKQKNPNILVGIIGCVAQKLGNELLKKFNFVDFVLGTKDMYKIADFLKIYDNNLGNRIVRTDLDYKISGYQTENVNAVSAYITVIRGCTNFCSYCIVPSVRGPENSRSIEEITNEAKKLAKNGVKEIVLLGQNVNIFGADINTNLEELLGRLNEIDGLQRLRYLTSHPKSVNQKFIETIKNIPKVCEHIHIPFQSGSNKILNSMNRKYSREEYIDKIKMIRSIIPNVSITSDVIVGYPLERDANFAETVSLLEECRLDNVYSFKYSPREGTVAYKTLKDNISKEKKEERLALLNKVEAKISKEINESLINTNQEVLWENIKIYQSEKLLEGRTRTYKKVFAPFRENRVGELDFVKITKSTNYSLIGEIVKS